MTKKLQRMTPNPTNPNPTSNRSKNRGQKSQELPPIFATIQGKIGIGKIQTKKMNTLPRPAHLLTPSSMALLQSCFSSDAAQQSLLCLHHCAPPLASRRCPLPLLPHTSSTTATTHLLIVVFCHCHQHCCHPSATNRGCLSFASSTVSLQPPLSSTSSYCCC